MKRSSIKGHVTVSTFFAAASLPACGAHQAGMQAGREGESGTANANSGAAATDGSIAIGGEPSTTGGGAPASSSAGAMPTAQSGAPEGSPIGAPLTGTAPSTSASGDANPTPATPVPCTALATQPENGLMGNPSVKSATSKIIAANGTTPAFCQVDVLFGTTDQQNINIRVGLPLNDLDGGSGGLHGAWNGRTQGVGGGGCSGSLTVTDPVSQGYVGSGTDLGHSGGDCEPGVNTDGTYNLQFIQDFIRDAIKQQILFSKAVAATYYAAKPNYNYWNGCSTGGRQGYLLAQELPGELDGILASAPAMYWSRFQTAQMWGEIAMKELVGGPIAAGKLNQATASAVAACDAADGVADGIIDDPRTCNFSAGANICGTATAPATNCLTAQEAQAIDLIWDGPRNASGGKIWFGLDRGTALTGLNGAAPFALGTTQFHWDEHDRNFDWTQVTTSGYSKVAQDGSQNIADITDTFGDLDGFKAAGGKLLTFVGGNDQLIYPRGVINYYRAMALRYGNGVAPDFAALQSFYRLFRAPGVGHCGGGDGPQPQNLFGALVDWVEKGNVPDQILAAGGTGGNMRTRPLCPYPQTAVYGGSGSTDTAESFSCGGNLEQPQVVCADALVTYKSELAGAPDFTASGLDPAACANANQ
ncbi:MAG TPA: tannase/feruloyl esterase family alpha/beta hydrolase [Polyangiaceae bacterium]|nr:tannase/feruloyl esterase family alpha/beta hydrolase [Polyangiaceae bacterium]